MVSDLVQASEELFSHLPSDLLLPDPRTRLQPLKVCDSNFLGCDRWKALDFLALCDRSFGEQATSNTMEIRKVAPDLGNACVPLKPLHGHDNCRAVCLVKIEGSLSLSSATMVKEYAVNFGAASCMSQSCPVETIVLVEIVTPAIKELDSTLEQTVFVL